MLEQDPFLVLITTTKPLVLSAVRRYLRTAADLDHEDIVQEVDLLLYTRWRQGKLSHLENPEAYVYTVAKHVCLHKNRRRETVNIADIDEPTFIEEAYLSPEGRIVLSKAMARVPEKYGTLLNMVLSGYTPADLVHGLKLPLNTVKSLLFRGKTKLKEALEKERYHDNLI